MNVLFLSAHSSINDCEGKYLAEVERAGRWGKTGRVAYLNINKDFSQCYLASQCNIIFHYPPTVTN